MGRCASATGHPTANTTMNLLVISTDTWRADYIGSYGNDEIHTPNLDRLAAEGVLFENAFAEGLPTLNARRIYFTGRHLFPEWDARPHKGDHLGNQPGWHAFDEDDVTLAECLQAKGYTTGFIADTYHMFKPTGNYHRGFDSWQWVRGQEQDRYVTGPRDQVDFSPYVKPGTYKRRRFQGLEQYLLNTMHRQSEDDFFTAQVLAGAAQWLRDNVGNQPFLLWADCFDPHEPWDPPRRCADLYCPGHDGPDIIWPPGDRSTYTDAEWQRVRALYMGEITFLDEWIGRVLDTLDELGLAQDTVVAFTSDHGTLLGEQGLLRKKHEYLLQGETRLPLIVRTPDKSHAGKRIEPFVQAHDFMPTWLHLLGEDAPDAVTGQNAWQLVTGEAASIYDYAVTAYGAYASVRDHEWNYVQRVGELYKGETDVPAQLYHVPDDPLEERNVVEEQPAVVAKMQARLARRMAGDLTQRDG